MSTEEPTAHCARYTEKQGERSRLRTLCRHSQQPPWGRVVGGARGWGGSYTYTSTVVCIHCAGGWSLLLTASRTVPPSLSSWGAEHNEKPPTTSTPGSDTSNHCPALKETVGLETFNSNPFTVGESCFTPTTVACDVTYRKQTTHSSIGRARSAPAAVHTHRDTGRGGGCPPRICARPTSSSGGCCLATQSPYGRQQLVVDDPSADVNRSRDLLGLSKFRMCLIAGVVATVRAGKRGFQGPLVA